MTTYTLPEGDITVANGTVTRWDGVTLPETPELVASIAAAAQNWADEQAARAAREATLAAPLTPAPIEGTTVEEVKASAEASLTDLATQMQERLRLLGGV